MMSDRDRRIDQICHAALAFDGASRDAFVAAACAGDDSLRREVDSLLRQQSKADGFLAEPALALAARDLAAEADDTLIGRRTPSGAGSGAAVRLAPGQDFGPYRIVRLLGHGGMGDAYEAEQLEHGRRVALKVLSQRLTDPQDRARFLREGQLAASINHPHTVYIFGSEEIAGTPVIAMELLAGGTLKDRVREQGPLPPADAVDAILQVIAGLDAAHAGGILHRDVKPANCFVDRDGTVKVGDFGLSISTMARDVTLLTRTGTFQGTPQFAAPEQLKGDPLDVRADIYAVGATLYYLLTGQPPFDDADLMAFLTRIATEVPRSPQELQPRVPRALAAIVLRCLAKDRAARPATYAALDEALRPFGSSAPTPATLGLRFVAGAIDLTILSLALVSLNMVLTFRDSAADFILWLFAIGPAMFIAYYGMLEGLWAASIGKRMTGLVVTKADGQPAGMARALWRAVVFETPIIVSELSVLELVAISPLLASAAGAGAWVLMGLLFSTARRRNGFAGLHELTSGTRVVRRLERGARSVLDTPRDPARAAGPGAQRYGPYDVVGILGRTDVGELLIAFDPRLRRHVWIHTLPPGAAAMAPLIRDLSRPARLRWLSGRRDTSEAWDAYEALDGVPLVRLLDAPRPWRMVRPWLLDLAQEIDAGLTDGSVAALTIDRVWITREGYAKLLDFGAPGVPPAAHQREPTTLESGQTFLAFVARHALDGSSGVESGATAAGARDPLPSSASVTLETLARHGFSTWSEVVARTAALLQGPDRVRRGRRAASLAICGLVTVSMALTILVIFPLVSRARTPDVIALDDALRRLSSLSPDDGGARAQERAALEVYIAGRFRPMITDPQVWTNPATAEILGPRRPLAERVVADHPNVSSDELAAATAAFGPFLRPQELRRASSVSILPVFGTVVTLAVSLTLTALFGILWAFVLRGGLLLRACGIAVVTGDGKPASRLRAFWRELVAWGLVPAAFWFGVLRGGLPTGGIGMGTRLRITTGSEVAIGISLGVLFLVGVVWTLVHPTRGLQDRIAGTWLVPR
jgi:hypothetical protein